MRVPGAYKGWPHDFTDKLAEGLRAFVKAFYPRPVVYRTTDFKTNDCAASATFGLCISGS